MKTIIINKLEDVTYVMEAVVNTIDHNAYFQNKFNKRVKYVLIGLGINHIMTNSILRKQQADINNLKKEIKELKETKGE